MGEVSNFRAAGSGHLYFTLKDENAQLRAVCFRNLARYYNGPGYYRHRYDEGIARWFREFRTLM